MANRRQGYGGGGRSFYNSGPLNPWQVGNAPVNQGGHFNNGNQSNLLSQLSEPQAQLALAITKLLQPQQQVPSLLTMNTVNPLQNSGGYGHGPNNYPQRGRGNMNNRRPRPDMKPYNKMNSRNNRDTDFNRRRANSNKKTQPQQRNTVVSKPKKPSSTKASSKSPGKTAEVKKTPPVKEEKDGETPTADTTETAVKESDDKSEDVESSDKKRDWKEEKNENDEAEVIEIKEEEENEETEVAEKSEETTTPAFKSKSGKFVGISKELLHCHICQKKMWDGESFEKHMNGRAHMQMFEKVEESYRIKADMMREAIRLAEEKHNIEMDRMKRLGKKTKTQQLSRCAMCDLDFYGQLFVHRKSPSHQKLKHFLHPRCSYCNKEFPTRMEWENHRHTAEHLIKKSENMDKKKTKSGSTGTDDEGILIEDECFVVIDSTESDDHEEENAVTDLTDDISEAPEIQIPSYKSSRAVGLSMISPVSGFFCKPCSRFFLSEKASQQHAQSKQHFDSFVNLLNEKVAENEEKKRKAVEEEDDDEGNWKRRKTSKEETDESKVDDTLEDDDKDMDDKDMDDKDMDDKDMNDKDMDDKDMDDKDMDEKDIDDKDIEDKDLDKTENGEEFYDPSETFNTTDPNDICLSDSSKNENSILNDEVWNEVDNKIGEIIESAQEEEKPQPVPAPMKSILKTPSQSTPKTPSQPTPKTPSQPTPKTPSQPTPKTPSQPTPKTPSQPTPKTSSRPQRAVRGRRN